MRQAQNAATHLTVPKTAPYNSVIQSQMSRSTTVEKSLYSGKNPGCEMELTGLESRTPLHLSVVFPGTKDVLKDHSSMPALHVTRELPNPKVREEPRGMEKEARPGFSHLRELTSHSTTEPRPSSYPKLPPAHMSSPQECPCSFPVACGTYCARRRKSTTVMWGRALNTESRRDLLPSPLIFQACPIKENVLV